LEHLASADTVQHLVSADTQAQSEHLGSQVIQVLLERLASVVIHLHPDSQDTAA